MMHKSGYLQNKINYQLLLGNHFNTKNQSGGNSQCNEKTERYLALYKKLNFEGGNKQNFELMKQIYDPNVTIKMANGISIQGIDKNIEMMKGMYVAAPDVKITEHNIQFGSGDRIAVSYFMTGTFTGPMHDPITGNTYQPTGKKFKMQGCSLVLWKDDKIIEELIFWDESKFLEQIGVKEMKNRYHSVFPTLFFNEKGNASQAIKFYEKLFNAKELYRVEQNNKIMHAEIVIGNSVIMIADEMMGSKSANTLGNTPVVMYVYVDDVDAIYNKALSMGSKSEHPLATQSYGDRIGAIIDPYGYKWTIATHVKDVPAKQIEEQSKVTIKGNY